MNCIETTPVCPSVSISQIKFSGGDKFHFSPTQKILIVGANNSGKSRTLREINDIIYNGKHATKLVVTKDLKLSKDGDASTLREYVLSRAQRNENGILQINEWRIQESNIQFWDDDYLVNGIASGFVRNITTKERLMICDQQSSIGPRDAMKKPQHVLVQDDSLMEKISVLFRRAFGSDLMFDFKGGSKLPIHVGNIPSGTDFVDRVSNAYVTAVRSQPLLDEQGDGMKSYAGILFEAVASSRDLTLLDEPEAFLHPPQMRRLGETLAQQVKKQLIVATHSSDVLRGFLEGSKGDVRILRIRREGEINKVFEASPKAIKELWEKPALRYSNALEGIFHEQTILCEDDSDCRLFNSIADHLENQSDFTWLDTAYVPTGGKAAIRKVAAVLRRIGVPIKAVFDIDFLSDRPIVQETVEAFGGDWANFESEWRKLDMAVRNGIAANNSEGIKSEIKKIIDSSAEMELPRSKISAAMKQNSPWEIVKLFGSSAIPKGDAQHFYQTLANDLEKIGIYLVPCGEAENFCRAVGGHGPAFVTKLLSEYELDDPILGDLRMFVERVHMGAHAPLESASYFSECSRDIQLAEGSTSVA